VLVLAGCRLDVDVSTTIGEDGHGSVTVTLQADAELLARAPGALADLRLDDLKAAGWTASGPTVAASGGATLTLSKPFATPEQATQVLAEVSGTNGPLQGMAVAQQRLGTRLTTSFSGQAQPPGLEGFADPQLVAALGGVPLADRVTAEQLAAGFGLTVRAWLPGTVVSTTGAASDGTVTWQPVMQPGVVTPLTAQAEHRDPDPVAAHTRETWANRAFWAWLGVLAVAAVVGIVWWGRRRHSSAN
jgi:cobalamin biosynthesis Mg chelatase CobN